MKRLRFLLTLVVLALMAAPRQVSTAAPAEQSNLLLNGGFEQVSGSTGTNWLPWWTETPKPADGSFNYAYKPNWNVESLSGGAAAPLIYAGSNSQRIINNWDPWWAGVKQTISAPAGATVRLTAYARAWASSSDWPAADTSVPVRIQVGIEPNGTDNQFASSVVWSGAIAPHGGWQPVSVQATVGSAGKVTVVLSADYRGASRLWMGAFFDEVSLTAVSSGPAPAPTSSGGQPAPTQPPSAPQPTRAPFILPTPGADGNIIYTVQAGDTGWSIAANAGLTLDELSRLNGGINLSLIYVGQKLVIGQAAPSVTATPTSAPEPTQDPNAPTPTTESQATTAPQPTSVAATNTGLMCVALYDDVNGNGRRDTDEGPIAGGALTLLDSASGAPVEAYTTQAGEDEHCFENLAPGLYTIAAAPPSGYNPTTSNSLREIKVDESTGQINIEFGAQKGSAAGGAPTQPAGDDGRLRTALFGAAGIMLILLAAGLGTFLFLRRR